MSQGAALAFRGAAGTHALSNQGALGHSAVLVSPCAGFRRAGVERAFPRRRWPTSGGREDDELLSRPGHRDIAVDRSFDARAERFPVDEDDQVELEPFP